MTQEILHNDHATLYYHEDEKIVHHVFHQPIGGDDFRSVLTHGVDLMAENEATKWLSDDRKNSGVNEEDTQWVHETWFDSAKEAGWKYWALVVPEEVSGRMNMTQFVDMIYEAGIRVMVFSDPDEAMDWLKRL